MKPLLTAFVAFCGALMIAPCAQALGGAPVIEGNFTYEQARALGVRTLPTPSELGLPMCAPNPKWHGFASPEEAEATLRRARADHRGPDCAVDPRSTLYSIRNPFAGQPTKYGSDPPQYRHIGAVTWDDAYGGGRITVEVGDPSVGHGIAEAEFVVSRVLITRNGIEDWIEGGWAEVSWLSDTRYVYTFLGSEFVWHFHTQFPLATGSCYIFRTESIFGAGGPYAEIWWDGNWMVLQQHPSFANCYPGSCSVEEFTEVYSDRFVWPVMNAPVDGSGVNHSSTMLHLSNGNWAFWNDSLYPSLESNPVEVSPYNACWINRDWNFRAAQGQC